MTLKRVLPLIPIICFFLLTACSTSKKSSSGLSREDQMRSEIATEAENYIGIRYKYAGKTPRTGFDCSGFTSYVLGKFNVEVSPASKIQAKEGRKVDLNSVQPGDLIYYKRNALGPVFHVSLVVSNDRNGITVIHSVSRGVTKENISKSSYWKPKIAGARDVISR